MMRVPTALAAVLLCFHTAFGQPVNNLPTPTERMETDRNGNGKLDNFEESYKLSEDLVLRTVERIDEETGSVQVRLTLVTFQGTPFWTETWAKGLHITAVERNCPYGIGWSATGIAFFDKDRNLTAAIAKNDNDRWVPASQDIVDVANGMVDTFVELEKEMRNESPVNEDQSANDPTDLN